MRILQTMQLVIYSDQRDITVMYRPRKQISLHRPSFKHWQPAADLSRNWFWHSILIRARADYRPATNQLPHPLSVSGWHVV